MGTLYKTKVRDELEEDFSVVFIPMIFFSISILFSLIGNIRGSAKNGIFDVILYTLVSIITKVVLLAFFYGEIWQT